MKAETLAPPTSALPQTSSLWILLQTALIAGTLDITDNIIFNAFRRITPKMIFEYIASGLLGTRAFHAGMASVALGVLLHYSIALIWTAVFYAARTRLHILRRRPVLSGLLYGLIVYVFMTVIVVPHSRIPHISPMTVASRINGVLAVMLFIGLTISLLLNRAQPSRNR